MIRPLTAGDRAALEAFLSLHRDSSLFLLAALDQPIFTAGFRGDQLVGVVAHFAHGPLAVQCPAAELLPELVRQAVQRPVTVISGPYEQIVAARATLGLDRKARFETRDRLYTLDLAALRLPVGALDVSPPSDAELPVAVGFRADYVVELLGQPRTPELPAELAPGVRAVRDAGNLFVLRDAGVPVALSLFNARLPDTVQIGGVWTPVPLRGRGFARAVVAGSLVLAQAQGVRRAVLFTGCENLAAQRAYEALGFVATGESFGLAILT